MQPNEEEIVDYIQKARRGITMSELSTRFKNPQKIVANLVKSGKLEKKIYCYGSGGYNGFGFRTRPWTWIYVLTN